MNIKNYFHFNDSCDKITILILSSNLTERFHWGDYTLAIHKMAISSTIPISSEEARAAMDKVLEKVAKQLRELNNYV